MYTVIITGGLGAGKSELTRILCEKGAISLDLDAVAHSLLESNESVAQELAQHFGQDILDENGMVVRSKLAQRAFVSEDSVEEMNAITFPHILEIAADSILGCSCSPLSDALCQVIEVPLLDKAPDLAHLADEVIAVVASPDIRVKRAIKRGMDSEDALRRVRLQINDDERIALSDSVCINEGTTDDLRKWADNWWNSRFSTLNLWNHES